MAGPLMLHVIQGLLAVLLILCAQRPVLSIPITGTAFPFETCKVSQLRGRYQVELLGSEAAYTNAILTRLALFPVLYADRHGFGPAAQQTCITERACNQGLTGPLLLCTQTYLSRYFKLPEDEGWTFCLTTQMTSLALGMSNPSQAEGVELCFSLQPPCPSLPEFAFDGQVLEYSMYDVKASGYQCCPSGIVEVVNDTFSVGRPPNLSSLPRPPLPPPRLPP
ncbi:predicted protein, partial [Haematococcus lacustris]